MKLWIKVGGLLLLIWALAATVVFFARSSRPDPEKLAEYVRQNPVAELQPTEREKVMERVIRDLNRMSFEQRRELQRSRVVREFFEELPRPEQEIFLERTLPEGFRQMMIAFNEMEPERRKRLVERALADIEEAEADGRMEERRTDVDAAMAQKIIEEGLQAFYNDASADVKLDMAPVLERIQDSLQTMR